MAQGQQAHPTSMECGNWVMNEFEIAADNVASHTITDVVI
jgi:hypothetical protein